MKVLDIAACGPLGVGLIHQPTTIVSKEDLVMADSARIDSYCVINAEGGMEMGANSVIHANSQVIGTGELQMGSGAAVTYGCTLLTSTADLSARAATPVPIEQRKVSKAPIELADESFVGSGAVVAPGVTVGHGGVIAANTYCDVDVPAGAMLFPDGSVGSRPPGNWQE